MKSLRENSAALAVAARAAGLSAAVPPCPGWDVEKLVRHIGRVQGGAAAVVKARGPVDRDAQPDMPKGEGCIEEFERRSVDLADALDALPEDFPIWNWFGIDPPIPGFYHRRMAQEVGVHRWDAEAAAGATAPIDAALAADGLDELFMTFLTFGPAEVDLGGSMHLHATDADSEWFVTTVDRKLVATPEHAKADAAVRGSASDLLLFAWNRIAPAQLEVIGDASVPSAWAEKIKL